MNFNKRMVVIPESLYQQLMNQQKQIEKQVEQAKTPIKKAKIILENKEIPSQIKASLYQQHQQRTLGQKSRRENAEGAVSAPVAHYPLKDYQPLVDQEEDEETDSDNEETDSDNEASTDDEDEIDEQDEQNDGNDVQTLIDLIQDTIAIPRNRLVYLRNDNNRVINGSNIDRIYQYLIAERPVGRRPLGTKWVVQALRNKPEARNFVRNQEVLNQIGSGRADKIRIPSAWIPWR